MGDKIDFLLQIVGSIADLLDWFGEKEKVLINSPPISTELDTLDKQLAGTKVLLVLQTKNVFFLNQFFAQREKKTRERYEVCK